MKNENWAPEHALANSSTLLRFFCWKLGELRILLISLGILLGFLPVLVSGAAVPACVQEWDNQITAGKTVNAAFPASTASGNLIVAFVVWSNTSSVSLADSVGNAYTSASGSVKWHIGRYSAQVFYAKNIKGGVNTVTATFSNSVSSFGTLYVHEYSGLDANNPLDVAVSAAGFWGSLNSGSIATTNATDLLFAAGVSDGTLSSPGAGYTIRSATHGDMTMDRFVTTKGSYNATALNSGGTWAMLLMAFKAATTATDTVAPTVPVGLTATPVSSSQVDLAWNASTDSVNTSGQLTYGIYRNSARIATTPAGVNSWSDTGLASSTTYSYAVTAQDASGNASGLSQAASATTLTPSLPAINVFGAAPASIIAGQSTTLSWTTSNTSSLTIDQGVGIVTGTFSKTVNPLTTTVYTLTGANGTGTTTAQVMVTVTADTQAPTVPTNLIPTAASSSRIDLTWNASTDNVFTSGYQIYRNGLLIGNTASTSYADTGLAANTTYTYAVAALDASGNLSDLSIEASEATFAASIGNYVTSIPLAENPIFENGNWTNGKANGLDWADVQTTGGLAYGTESGSGGYDDSTAILTGTWGPNQTARATVYTINQQTGNIYEEVELRLRSSISAHRNTGYEITFRCIKGGGYVQIVRWNGPLGSYSYITSVGNSNYRGIQTGDVVSASISGNLIIAYVNGVEVCRGTDSTYTSGNPGIGFYLQGGSSSLNNNFGFTSFSATDGSATDTQVPTAPTNLAAAATSPSQINLSWTVSSDNVGVAGYQVYRNGAGVGVTAAATYSDTGLPPNTTCNYAVSAFDSAGNNSALSTLATATTPSADLLPPSIPANLQSISTTSSTATITWSASTDNVAVSGYRIFRNGIQVGNTNLTSYTDTGLTPLTNYAYTLAAFDASNNISPQSGQLFVTTSAAASQPPSFVQCNNNQISSGSATTVAFKSPTRVGNTVVAYVIWSNTGNATLADTNGNIFTSATNPVTWGANYRAQVFYAVNIKGGSDTVTATFQNAVGSFGVVYIHEYSGINPLNPIDTTTFGTGTSSAMNSGTAVTTYSNDLIFGAGVSGHTVTAAGSGFSPRCTAYGNLTEDRIATLPGSYNATATQNGSTWAMQLIAFRAAN